MAVVTTTTPMACAEGIPSSRRLSEIMRRFLALARRLAALRRDGAALDDEAPWSPGFHRLLRRVEEAERRITGDVAAILASAPVSATDQHLRSVAWRLRVALSLEDRADSAFYLDALTAWPDLLYVPQEEPEAPALNAAIHYCVETIAALYRRDAPPLQMLRVIDPGPDGGAAAMTLH